MARTKRVCRLNFVKSMLMPSLRDEPVMQLIDGIASEDSRCIVVALIDSQYVQRVCLLLRDGPCNGVGLFQAYYVYCTHTRVCAFLRCRCKPCKAYNTPESCVVQKGALQFSDELCVMAPSEKNMSAVFFWDYMQRKALQTCFFQALTAVLADVSTSADDLNTCFNVLQRSVALSVPAASLLDVTIKNYISLVLL
eukprot:16299-Heterococcus_DN1.PRE.1